MSVSTTPKRNITTLDALVLEPLEVASSYSQKKTVPQELKEESLPALEPDIPDDTQNGSSATKETSSVEQDLVRNHRDRVSERILSLPTARQGVRLRRAKTLPSKRSSISSVSKSSLEFQKARPSDQVLPHFYPVHTKIIDSQLSRGGNNPARSYAGFQNLAILLAAVGIVRLVMENYRHYGFIKTAYQLGMSPHDVKLSLVLTASVPLHLFIALLIERLASSIAFQRISEKKHGTATKDKPYHSFWAFFAILHAFNVFLVISVATFVVYNFMWHPFLGTACICHSIIVCLKVTSYALANRDLRHAYVAGYDLPPLYRTRTYPTNLSVTNLVYFWWAPTLVYQPVYPRSTHKRRPLFILNRVLEIVGIIFLVWFISGQYAIPILKSSLMHFHNKDLYYMTERLLRLSTVSIIVWLLMFFCIFQSLLNLLAEIMAFGDREFYDDWWNAGSVATYWRKWNKPVNSFFKRHVYRPLLRRGYSALASSFVVFFISAILHEVLVGIPTHSVIGAAFLCMLLQMPLSLVTAPMENMRGQGTTIGNCIFWVSFLLGQPVAVLLYYFSWNIKYGGTSL